MYYVYLRLYACRHMCYSHEPYVIAGRRQNPSEKPSQMPLCCSQNTGRSSKGINVGMAKRVWWGAVNSEQRNGWGKVHGNLAAQIHGGRWKL